jgi:hypothetical protein
MLPRRVERESLAYIDCEIPEDMTLREWRGTRPVERPKRLRDAVGRVTGRARKRD